MIFLSMLALGAVIGFVGAGGAGVTITLRVVVDAERNLLLNVLPYHPFLIKPNNHELGAIFGQSLTTDEEIEACARELKSRGAQNVLISMAGDGAMLIPAEGPRRARGCLA